eukprot:360685-Chlamydomonas_euryale.AAC.1
MLVFGKGRKPYRGQRWQARRKVAQRGPPLLPSQPLESACQLSHLSPPPPHTRARSHPRECGSALLVLPFPANHPRAPANCRTFPHTNESAFTPTRVWGCSCCSSHPARPCLPGQSSHSTGQQSTSPSHPRARAYAPMPTPAAVSGLAALAAAAPPMHRRRARAHTCRSTWRGTSAGGPPPRRAATQAHAAARA